MPSSASHERGGIHGPVDFCRASFCFRSSGKSRTHVCVPGNCGEADRQELYVDHSKRIDQLRDGDEAIVDGSADPNRTYLEGWSAAGERFARVPSEMREREMPKPIVAMLSTDTEVPEPKLIEPERAYFGGSLRPGSRTAPAPRLGCLRRSTALLAGQRPRRRLALIRTDSLTDLVRSSTIIVGGVGRPLNAVGHYSP